MAVTWVTYSPDFAQWKWTYWPGRTMTATGRIRLHLGSPSNLIAQADVEERWT